MAIALELVRDLGKDEREVFTQTYKNSEVRRIILEAVIRKYEVHDRPRVSTYDGSYAFAVAHYDGYRQACEDIMRLLDV